MYRRRRHQETDNFQDEDKDHFTVGVAGAITPDLHSLPIHPSPSLRWEPSIEGPTRHVRTLTRRIAEFLLKREVWQGLGKWFCFNDLKPFSGRMSTVMEQPSVTAGALRPHPGISIEGSWCPNCWNSSLCGRSDAPHACELDKPDHIHILVSTSPRVPYGFALKRRRTHLQDSPGGGRNPDYLRLVHTA